MSQPNKPTTDNPASAFIRITGVTHSYPEGNARHLVLDNTTIAINRHEKVALLGRSGSGKTTLLNLVAGIDKAEKGSVTVDGLELTALDEKTRTLFRRQHVGFVYQFFNLVPTLTALENVAFTLELNGVRGSEARERSLALLERLGMAGKADSFPTRLSGGEQQRVAIARALVHRPAIVLADEPTGNLDMKTGEDVLAVFHEVLQENNSALLLVTHSLAVAGMADRILTLENGEIAERDGDFAW